MSAIEQTRARSFEWTDPLALAAGAEGLSGLETMRAILAGNAAELYDFDLEKLAPLAAKAGPTVAELHEPLTTLPENPNEALLKSFEGALRRLPAQAATNVVAFGSEPHAYKPALFPATSAAKAGAIAFL